VLLFSQSDKRTPHFNDWLRQDGPVRPDEKEAKTYQDLMWLLPDVSKIKIWWTRDEDGLPQFIDRVALRGHDGELLIEIDTDDVEELPGFSPDGREPAEHDLLARLPAALAILRWINEWNLEEEDDASIVVLPSASHVSDEPPQDWASPNGG
jgi:hypothetical protein